MWKNLLSIFKWQKTSEQKSEKPKSGTVSIKTVGDVKTWVETELPPLAWHRINLKVIKYSINKHNLVLIEAPQNIALPDDLLIEISKQIKELYDKELPVSNKTYEYEA